MENLKIYGINIGGLVFSVIPNINPNLQTIVLILTIVYTSINIFKQLNK
tara:strand:+ start:232 stop:378 length:147 start_codon:yes stop_codon:yes gene_type:complete